MISINKHRVQISGDLETIGSEFMLLSSTLNRRFNLKPSELAYLVRAAYEIDQTHPEWNEEREARYTVTITKGRNIFNI